MNYRLPLTIVLLCYHAVLGSEELSEDESDTADASSLSRVRRGGLSMLRLGRGLQMLRLGKRALPMLRLGRSTHPAYSDEGLQYLLSLMRKNRQVPLPRYGKDMDLEYMIMNALKNAQQNVDLSQYIDDDDIGFGYGYDLASAPERHIRPAPRPGMRYRRSTDDVEQASEDATSDDQNVEYDDDVVKRAMRMLRLGRGMRMLRLGKRPMDSGEYTEADKRALRLLRLGKRPFNMLRLGRSDSDSDEIEKRALRLLRLGRAAADES